MPEGGTRIKSAIATIALLQLISGCSNSVTTRSLLDGDFLTAGEPNIDLISPIDSGTSSVNPVFSWGAKSTITRYRIEIARDVEFQAKILDKIVTGNTYTLATQDLLLVSGLDAVQYYWRVSVPYVTVNLVSKTQKFNVIAVDSVFVDISSSVGDEVGNKAAPFKQLQTAIEYAKTNGRAQVLVSKGTYNEPVLLRKNVMLKGGYDAQNSWQRDTAANISTIQSTATSYAVQCIGVSAGAISQTGLDGFRVVASASAVPGFGLYASACNASILNNIMTVQNGNDVNGIYATSSSNLMIRSNTIAVNSSNTVAAIYGIYADGSSQITAEYNQIRVYNLANGVQPAGVRFINANGYIRGNTITVTTLDNHAYGINLTGTSYPEITNNAIFVGSSSSNTSIVAVCANLSSTAGTPVIFSNNLFACHAKTTQVSHAILAAGAGARVTNNLFLFARGNSTTRYGYSEQSTHNAISVENNAFWDLQTNAVLFYDVQTTSSKQTINAIELLTDWAGGTDKARGNIKLPNGNAGNPFVNFPLFHDVITATNNSTQLTVAEAGAGYVNNEYFEINGDGIPRKITSGAGTTTLNFSPAIENFSTFALYGAEIRYWGAHAGAAACFPGTTVCATLKLNLGFQANALALQDLNNLKYGGKNTVGANCGANAGYPIPASGAGNDSCGSVSLDTNQTSRTTTLPGVTPPINLNAGGISIGPTETD